MVELNIGSETPYLIGISTTIASLAQWDLFVSNLASLVLGSGPAGLLRPAPMAQSRELAAWEQGIPSIVVELSDEQSWQSSHHGSG